MFYLVDILQTSIPGHSISNSVLKRQILGGKSGYIEVFVTKDQVVGTSKSYC